MWWCGAPTAAPSSSRPGRRIAPSWATSSRPCKPTPPASWASSRFPLADAQRIIAIGSDRMMAAVKNALAGKLKQPLPQPTHGHRLDQLADAVHDERDLRRNACSATSIRKRKRNRSSSAVSTRINRCKSVDFSNLNARLRQNSAAEKLTSLWIDHLFSARLVQTV